jgi:Serine/Threonine/Tyrosine Kinase found in polyvalent proteins
VKGFARRTRKYFHPRSPNFARDACDESGNCKPRLDFGGNCFLDWPINPQQILSDHATGAVYAMDDGYEKLANKPIGTDGKIESNSLESAEGHVATSAGTGSPGDASRKAFTVAFSALVEWAEARKLIRFEHDFPFFRRPTDGRGDEHEAWFDEKSNRWFKATYPDRFGLAWGREGTATAREYLSRLVLQNKFFRDDIRFVALINSSQHLRVLTSQPHIAGERAPANEIKQWFLGLGFVRLETGDRIAWYRERENLLVADAHEGNVIKSTIGDLVPIDLNVIQPGVEMREWVIANLKPAKKS